MKLRLTALLLAASLLLAACGAASSSAPPSSEPASSEAGQFPGQDAVLTQDGKLVITPLEDILFTMEYEPASTAVTAQHLGLEFPTGMDTVWLGDTGFDADYTIFDTADQVVRGTVKISTAPPDLAAHYGTTDPEEQLNRMKANYFPTIDVYEGRKKAVVDDFGYDLIRDEQGVVESLGWNGFFIEFIDHDTNTRSMRFFVCNDEMNERYYSFAANVDLPADDTAMADRYRAVLFTLKPMGEAAA